MSDLSLRLQQAASQLPVSSYFDEALFRREQELLFARGPRYVGHALSVPEPGDYHALPQEGEGRALVRSPQGRVELISNVCRHRQALMLKGRGSLQAHAKGSAGGNIVCPVHRWTYSPGGELLGAPHFTHDPCLNLQNYPLREWNGLLFEDNGYDLAAGAVGPAVHRADDVAGGAALLLRVQRAAPGQHQRLAVAADIGDQLDPALRTAHQRAPAAFLGQGVVVARFGHAQRVAHIARAALEEQGALALEQRFVKVA